MGVVLVQQTIGETTIPFVLLAWSLFAQVFSLPCDWTDSTGRLSPLISGDIRTVTVSSEADCQDQCMNQTSFICAAINYRLSDKKCELLNENNETGTVETTQTEWKYFIRPLCAGIWFPWIAQPGSYDGHTDDLIKRENITSLRGCMDECMQTSPTQNSCDSIVIFNTEQQGRCRLTNHTLVNKTQPAAANTVYTYFNRPYWYRGDSPGVFWNNDLIDRSNIGLRFYAFASATIKTEGYLIGWQYYLKAVPDQCSGSSYVSLFGKNDNGVYAHRVSTHLQPLDAYTSGINFQFVPNRLIRVKKDDVVGLFTVNCYSHIAKHLVSAAPEGSARIHRSSHRLFQVTPTYTFSGLSNEKWKVSIKAYTAGYVKLDGDPLISRHGLKNGQIQIQINPQNLPNSQLGAVTYNITCYPAGSEPSQYSACRENHVPVGTTELILDGLDITKRYYAVVKVVRNFNGEELILEDEKQTGVFCAVRRKLTLVEVNLSVIDIGNDTASINISFGNKTTLKNDECAATINVEHQGKNTTFTANSSDLITLEVDKILVYTFTMYLRLADGHEMIYWEGEFDLTPSPVTEENNRQTTEESKDLSSVHIAMISATAVVLVILIVSVLFGYIIRLRTEQTNNNNTHNSQETANTRSSADNESVANKEQFEIDNDAYTSLSEDTADNHVYSSTKY